MVNKRKIQCISFEAKKQKLFYQSELQKYLYRFLSKSDLLVSSKYALLYALKTKKRNKRKSISYQTSVCMQTGHYGSRVNWGKLSRFSFKSSADKNNFSHLIKV